jgi:hypothetical protein
MKDRYLAIQGLERIDLLILIHQEIYFDYDRHKYFQFPQFIYFILECYPLQKYRECVQF